jgi:hypothetical protein
MSLDAIKAVVDLIEMGGVVGQEDIVKCLRSAIEQAEQQEPVCEYCGGDRFIAPPQQERQEPLGYLIHDSQFGSEDFSRLKPEAVNPTETVIPLYTAPPQRQPLTEEEIEQATGCDRNKPLWIAIENAARAVERAHAIGGKQ